MKTILITGINGFLGSKLAKKLINSYKLIGLEYSLENLFRIEKLDLIVYSSQDSLEKIFTENKIDIVIHTATVYRINNGSVISMIESNILLPIFLMELAEKYTVNTFINTDSFFNVVNTNYNYLNDYTLTKKHCIEWLKNIQRRTKVINMKLFHVYGPGDSREKFVVNIINDLKLNKKEIKLTGGAQMRDFIFVDDVIDAYTVVIENIDNHQDSYIEYEVGTGMAYSIKEFVNLIASLTNSSTKLLYGSLPYREGEIMKSVANNFKLLKLGWACKTSLKDGCLKIIVDHD